MHEQQTEDGLSGVGLEVEAPAAAEHGGRWGWLGAAISIVTIAAFVWWALRQDPPTIPTSAAALAELAAAVAVYAVATVIRGWRWHILLRRSHVEHEAADAFALIPVGYMGNAILPARGGEVLRVVLLALRTQAVTSWLWCEPLPAPSRDPPARGAWDSGPASRPAPGRRVRTRTTPGHRSLPAAAWPATADGTGPAPGRPPAAGFRPSRSIPAA